MSFECMRGTRKAQGLRFGVDNRDSRARKGQLAYPQLASAAHDQYPRSCDSRIPFDLDQASATRPVRIPPAKYRSGLFTLGVRRAGPARLLVPVSGRSSTYEIDGTLQDRGTVPPCDRGGET